MAPPRDPAGLLQRAPEIALLADADPAIFRAVERGDPHKVYRLLWWRRRLRRLPEHHALIDGLLAHRRLFLRAATRNPVLYTVNGVGAAVYGQSDPDPDGTYVKSHFVVFAFVPLFPLAQYLVADAGNGGWYFLGKVPMSWPLRVWNRLVVAAAAGGLAFGALQTFHATRHHDVHVVNGLKGSVTVAVGGVSIEVPGGQRRTLTARTGRQPVRVTDARGREIETGEILVDAGSHVLAWNVLGAAPLAHTTIPYGTPGGTIPDPRFFCGDNVVRVGRVDFVFKEPPAQIQLPDGARGAVRQHLGIAPGGLSACAGALARRADAPRATRLARALIAYEAQDPETVSSALALWWTAGKREEALAAAREAVAAHDDSVEHHRMYQSLAEDAGQLENLRTTYEARYRASPESADAAYLYARLLPETESLALGLTLLGKHPAHVPSYRLVAFDQVRTLKFDDAAATLQRLRQLDSQEWTHFIEEHVLALAGAGRKDEARALTEQAFAAADGHTRLRLIAVRAWMDGGRAPGTTRLMARFGAKLPEDILRLRVRFWDTDAKANLSTLPDRSFWQTVHDAQFKPAEALARAAQFSVDELDNLDRELLVLLYAEGQRLRHAAVERLGAALARGRFPREAVDAYLEGGTWAHSMRSAPLGVKGALHLARARRPELSAAERERLRALALRCDPAGGYVHRALRHWPAS